jgi:hypothetical protein
MEGPLAKLILCGVPLVSELARGVPAEYKDNIFAAEHGSWNRAKPTGYKIIRIAVKDGVPTCEYEDFVTSFAIDDARVWGRPVGVCRGRGWLATLFRGRKRHDLARHKQRPHFRSMMTVNRASVQRGHGHW